MEKEVLKHPQHNSSTICNNNSSSTFSSRERHIIGEGLIKPPQSTDFVLSWGNRKRLRCMKIQVKDDPSSIHRTTVRRVVRSENNNNNNNHNNDLGSNGVNNFGHGHFNLRQRAPSPAHPPQRILRNSSSNNNNNTEGGAGIMKGQNYHHSNGGLGSPEKKDGYEMKGGRSTTSYEKGGGGGGGSSSGGSEVVVWPPKFMIALTNKEKEEDFMAIKGSKLPQRPKKRAKFVQRTLNLVSPGGWLCDLTLDRYEVREKKTSKKRPRGLKAMGNYMDSDSD